MRLTLLALGVAAAACGSATTLVGQDAGSERDSGEPRCSTDCPGADEDGDGEPAPPCGRDCDDSDPAVGPGRDDPAGDGRDTDCDGADGVDRDGDGHVARSAGGDDCDDEHAFVHPGAPDGRGWVIEPFPSGIRTRLALDRWGKPLVASAGWGAGACYDDDVNALFDGVTTVDLTRWQAGVWSSEIVEQTCSKGALGLGVGDDGSIVIAYTSSAANELRSLRVARSGTPWRVETVDESLADVALLVDSCGQPKVAYTFPATDPSGGLGMSEGRLARWDGSWSTETFETGSPAQAISLAGEGENLWLSYWFGDTIHVPDLVKVARHHNRRWEDEDLEQTDCFFCVLDTSIALTRTGAPQVAYIGNGTVDWFERRDAGWQTDSLGSGPSGNMEPNEEGPSTVSLAVDGEGWSHVAYDDYDHVEYATNRGGTWATEEVGDAIPWGYGGWPSLALDRLGGVHLAWAVIDEDPVPYPDAFSGRYAVLARPHDGVDQNCDGVDGVDADGDGHASVATGGDDVDDADPGLH